MGFARCGVEGNLRKVIENTRKKLFHFLFFSYFKKMEKVFASVSSSSPPPVAVARTSQSPFPLPVILNQHCGKINYQIYKC